MDRSEINSLVDCIDESIKRDLRTTNEIDDIEPVALHRRHNVRIRFACGELELPNSSVSIVVFDVLMVILAMRWCVHQFTVDGLWNAEVLVDTIMEFDFESTTPGIVAHAPKIAR